MTKKSKIVEAVGAISINQSPGGRALAAAVQAAMSDAVLACNAEGITDPEIIREAMLAARERVKAG